MIVLPDTSTEVAIATTTLSSAASTITFSSIPSTYTDLRIVLTGTSSSGSPFIRFNSDTGTNYSYTVLRGDGTSASSSRESTLDKIWLSFGAGPSAGNPDFFTVDVFSYAGSTNKTCLTTSSMNHNGTDEEVARNVGLWRSTSAITTITLSRNVGNFNTGTTATLYGIL